MAQRSLQSRAMLLALWLTCGPTTALAVDGAVGVNQVLAEAGGVTPTDGPGFPITIDRSGLYRLTGDLSVPDADTDAIVISADGVTVDLNGFSIAGPAVCGGDPTTCTPTGSGRGIAGLAPVTSVTVRNGTVRGMGSGGIVLGDHSVVEGIRCRSNGASGILVGVDSRIADNTSALNGGLGIGSSGESAVDGNIVFRNGMGGVFAGPGSTVFGNTAGRNDGVGYFIGSGSSVTANTARDNDDLGLNLETGVGYAHNVLTSNNGGNAQPQAQGGIQTGPNVCGTDLCP